MPSSSQHGLVHGVSVYLIHMGALLGAPRSPARAAIRLKSSLVLTVCLLREPGPFGQRRFVDFDHKAGNSGFAIDVDVDLAECKRKPCDAHGHHSGTRKWWLRKSVFELLVHKSSGLVVVPMGVLTARDIGCVENGEERSVRFEGCIGR
jgi:hypothetical protein